jgi:soluble lytic murein transglycosylase-like protein
MPAPVKPVLARQLGGVKRWLLTIEEAAISHGFNLALLLAIGSRESNLNPYYQSHSGDEGNGYSMWQIDKRLYPEFVASGDWRDVTKAVDKAAEVLQEKLLEVRRLGKTAVRRPLVGGDAELRIAVAAYNTGSKRAFRSWLAFSDPDRATTGQDYSSDVMTRRNRFAELLAEYDK